MPRPPRSFFGPIKCLTTRLQHISSLAPYSCCKESWLMLDGLWIVRKPLARKVRTLEFALTRPFLRLGWKHLLERGCRSSVFKRRRLRQRDLDSAQSSSKAAWQTERSTSSLTIRRPDTDSFRCWSRMPGRQGSALSQLKLTDL